MDAAGDAFKSDFLKSHRGFREDGRNEALDEGLALIQSSSSLSRRDAETLEGYLKGTGRVILPEPRTLATKTPRVVGLDGRKMSKSYRNTIQLREDPDVVEQTVSRMQTDPARVRLKDPGDPEKCPVYTWHEIYLDDEQREWAANGCRTAAFGCRDCKRPLIDAINAEQSAFRERAQPYADDPQKVQEILTEGSEKARIVARETMKEVRSAIGIAHE